MNVLIIGGSSDIGISLAKCLSSFGYNVVSTYNNHKVNDMIKCDITMESDVENVIKYVLEKYGNIDILINMAAICMDNDFLNKTKKEFMKVLEVNLVGTFLSSQIYSKYIDNGIIINVSSTDGIDTYNNYNIDYAASKAGVINISKSISKCTNNNILCVCPNWIDSDSTKSMDNNFLNNELSRIGQDRLIKIDEFCNGIYEIINSKYESGSIIRMDIKDGKLWIEKVQ